MPKCDLECPYLLCLYYNGTTLRSYLTKDAYYSIEYVVEYSKLLIPFRILSGI